MTDTTSFDSSDLTARDAAYIAAVNQGDMATAEDIVAEAAKGAGYIGPMYHGTTVRQMIDVFDTKGHNQLGTHFSPEQEVAKEFTNDQDGRIYKTYLFLKNPYDIVSDLGDWSDMDMLREYLTEENEGPFTNQEFEEFKTSQDVQNGLIAKGYDGIKYDNAFEGTKQPVSYIIFDPDQIRSAEPVIYDNNGNPIPLSQRFADNKMDMSNTDSEDPEPGFRM